VIVVHHNQSLFDIAIQVYGTVAAAYDLALLNNISLTDDLEAGQQLLLTDKDYGLKENVQFYKQSNHRPATAWNPATSVYQPRPEGISYWAVNVDFVVSP
jgi:hypothetical protein